jgi:hypothetical protein
MSQLMFHVAKWFQGQGQALCPTSTPQERSGSPAREPNTNALYDTLADLSFLKVSPAKGEASSAFLPIWRQQARLASWNWLM